MIRASIFVYGKVQGVFFRAGAKEKADSLGVKGWAMNRDDGSVEILAEGEEKQIDELIKWCNRGSTLAQVDNVKSEKEPVEEASFEEFFIK